MHELLAIWPRGLLFNLGVFFLVCYAATNLYMYFRLKTIGYKWPSRRTRPSLLVYKDYQRAREKNGWPAWPVHVMWPLMWLGLFLFGIGSTSK